MSDKIEKTPKQIIILLSAFALLSILLHFIVNLFTAYGIFRDELYYIACSKRLDTGYVDHPPFSIYVLYLSRLIFGDSLFAIRIIPSVLSGAGVFLAGLLTYRVGGRVPAVILACVTISLAPMFLAIHSFYSMNALDFFFYTSAVLLLVNIIHNGGKWNWYLLGITIGLGLLNKIGFLWVGAGIFIGLLFTARGEFRKKEVYISGIIALILFSPYIFWNITHDFAHLEFIHNATEYRYSGVTRLDFILGNFMLFNPIYSPVWLAGIGFYLFNSEGKKYRIIGIIYVVSLIVLLINGNTKAEYLAPAYPTLFAGGAVLIERLFKKSLHITKIVLPSIAAVSGIFIMPLALQVLPVDTFIKYQASIGMKPSTSEGKELNELSQFYADMFGWENMAKKVSEVYSRLSESEKKKAVVFARNYGQAGAIEYFSSKYSLPPVVCPHNSCWYWLDEIKRDIKVVIVIGGKTEELKKSCESVESTSIIRHRYAMPYESNLTIFICTNLKRTIQEIWAESRFII